VDIIKKALEEGRTSLSEYESKLVLAQYRIPVTKERLVNSQEEAVRAAQEIGYPVVLKGCSPDITHKTESGLLWKDIRNDEEVGQAYQDISTRMKDEKGAVLVQEMVKGERELALGLIRDPQFGPCVMFGLGGIFTEILKDVSFRLAPIEKQDALEMFKEIKAYRILEEVRGMPPVDQDRLAQMLVDLGHLGLEHEGVKEVDINPVIISGTQPLAVDALIVLEQDA